MLITSLFSRILALLAEVEESHT